ncbi:MAG: alpha/beta fold hydrolase [Alphaproteobacteria bacterium]|nr:MAG: alpha/beta fold hydrolase [Alphaproteobacteria bacterium]
MTYILKHKRVALFTGVIFCAAALLAACKDSGKESEATKEPTLGFESGGKQIEVEHFRPIGAAAGKRPAVIVLHGSDGFLLGGSWYRDAAKRVAAAGYETYLVHYFNRTGDWRVTDEKEIHAKVPVWTETAKDAVAFVAGRPEVDAKRIGIVGISLGGAISIATAQQDKRVKVLVDYFGFVPKTFDDKLKLPPTIALHGADDKIVWASNSTRLGGVLTTQKVPHEVKIYDGVGHAFRGEEGRDADARVEAFLKKHL